MRLLQLDIHLLRLLDNALDGRLGDAFADVVRAGGEPELIAIRNRHGNGPSTWALSVSGGGAERAFDIDSLDRVALAIVVHLHVSDLVAEVRHDVGLNFKVGEIEDGLDDLTPFGTPKATREPS